MGVDEERLLDDSIRADQVGSALRSMAVVLTPEQAATWLEDGPLAMALHWQDRTVRLVGPVGPVEAGRPEVYTLAVTPLVHGGWLRKHFSTCGYGWVITSFPLLGGDVVDLVDDVLGPYLAEVPVASVRNRPGLDNGWLTLLHVRHQDRAPVPTILADLSDGQDVVEADVQDCPNDHPGLEPGASVEVVDVDGVRVGVVEQVIDGREPVRCVVRLVADEPDRRNPQRGWTHADTPLKPSLTDQMHASLVWGDPVAVAGPLDGRVAHTFLETTTWEDPWSPAAWQKALWVARGDAGPEPTPAEASAALIAAMGVEAGERGWTVDWEHVRLEVRNREVDGVFPLIW